MADYFVLALIKAAASLSRVLLYGKDVPDQISPFMYNEDNQCLDALWQVVEVDLLDQEAAD